VAQVVGWFVEAWVEEDCLISEHRQRLLLPVQVKGLEAERGEEHDQP
jgi:hypothetical protein